jgi:hypothetical protein
MRPGSNADDRETEDGAGQEAHNQYRQITDPEIVEPILDMLNDLTTDPAEFQAEQELIVWILEQHDGSAQLKTRAAESGVAPHELAVPLDLMHQSGIVEVVGSGDQLTISLNTTR